MPGLWWFRLGLRGCWLLAETVAGWRGLVSVVSGNATGAGDAVVAGLADGLVRGLEWPDLLRHAVALGAATVAAPVAGEFALDEYVRQHRGAKLSQINNSDSLADRQPDLRRGAR